MAAGSLCLLAPWIAKFYNEPILTSLTRALSLTIVINSFGLIQSALLTRDINFKTQTKVSLIASALSGIIAVALAISGLGVWSLVIQQIIYAFAGTVCLWLFSNWRPALIFSFKSLSSMFGFGSRVLASGLLNQIFDNIYLLVIGRLFSASALGFFTRAKAIQETPTHALAAMSSRVTFPIFSSIQDDPARLKRGLKKALTLLVVINFPLMIGLAVVAKPLVLVLLTEKWDACISYLQLFCIVGLLFPVHVMNLNVLQSMGRSELFLRLEIIKKILIVLNIAITWRWGITAMIYGMILLTFISFYLNSYYTGILIKYPLREQLRDISSYLILSILMGMMVYLAGMLPFPTEWSLLVVQIAIGIVIYVCLCWLFRLSAFMEIWHAGWRRMATIREGSAR